MGAYFLRQSGLVFEPPWPDFRATAVPFQPPAVTFQNHSSPTDTGKSPAFPQGLFLVSFRVWLSRHLALRKAASAADLVPVRDGDHGALPGGLHAKQRFAGQSLQCRAHGLSRPVQLHGDLRLRRIELPGPELSIRSMRCVQHAVQPQCSVVRIAPYGKHLHASRNRNISPILLCDDNHPLTNPSVLPYRCAACDASNACIIAEFSTKTNSVFEIPKIKV